jgi:hypothetical protein
MHLKHLLVCIVAVREKFHFQEHAINVEDLVHVRHKKRVFSRLWATVLRENQLDRHFITRHYSDVLSRDISIASRNWKRDYTRELISRSRNLFTPFF